MVIIGVIVVDLMLIGFMARGARRPAFGFARLQEVRDAILRFRESGKWAIASMETAGEFSPGIAAYYLASAFSSIWLAPPGDISLGAGRGGSGGSRPAGRDPQTEELLTKAARAG
jgi:hypothetical protein